MKDFLKFQDYHMMEIRVLVTGAKKRLNMEVLWHLWLVLLLGNLSTKQDFAILFLIFDDKTSIYSILFVELEVHSKSLTATRCGIISRYSHYQSVCFHG